MPGRPRIRLTAYLVTPMTERASSARVYAVRTHSAVEALAAVQATLVQGETPVIVGSLSTRMAKAIGLKAGEVRQI